MLGLFFPLWRASLTTKKIQNFSSHINFFLIAVSQQSFEWMFAILIYYSPNDVLSNETQYMHISYAYLKKCDKIKGWMLKRRKLPQTQYTETHFTHTTQQHILE